MSECVVRMDFPKRCCDCDMANGLTCMATGGVYGRDVPKMTWIRGKPEWCPIICALPENHGRLVDADELYMKIKGHDTTRPLLERRKGVIEEKHICLHDICKQHTIVPAERSET